MAFLGLFGVIFGAVAVGVGLLLRHQAFRRRRGGALRAWATAKGLSYLQESSAAALPFGHLPFFRASRWSTDVWHVAHGSDLWVADTRRAFGDAESASVERQTVVACRIADREHPPFRADPRELLGTDGEIATVPTGGLDCLYVEGEGPWVLVYGRGRFTPVDEIPIRVAQARAIAAAVSSR